MDLNLDSWNDIESLVTKQPIDEHLKRKIINLLVLENIEGNID